MPAKHACNTLQCCAFIYTIRLLTEAEVCKYVHMEKNSKKIIARLLSEGFEKVSQKGSHVKLRKGNRTVIVPHPKRDLPTGTARNIAKQAGWI